MKEKDQYANWIKQRLKDKDFVHKESGLEKKVKSRKKPAAKVQEKPYYDGIVDFFYINFVNINSDLYAKDSVVAILLRDEGKGKERRIELTDLIPEYYAPPLDTNNWLLGLQKGDYSLTALRGDGARGRKARFRIANNITYITYAYQDDTRLAKELEKYFTENPIYERLSVEQNPRKPDLPIPKNLINL